MAVSINNTTQMDIQVVTTPRTDVMYVVTEFGIVNLKGKSVAQRAQAMISISPRWPSLA